eukprot:315404-Rhodomonas_salina.1
MSPGLGRNMSKSSERDGSLAAAKALLCGHTTMAWTLTSRIKLTVENPLSVHFWTTSRDKGMHLEIARGTA